MSLGYRQSVRPIHSVTDGKNLRCVDIEIGTGEQDDLFTEFLQRHHHQFLMRREWARMKEEQLEFGEMIEMRRKGDSEGLTACPECGSNSLRNIGHNQFCMDCEFDNLPELDSPQTWSFIAVLVRESDNSVF